MNPLLNHPSAVRVLFGLALAVPMALLFSVYLFAVQPQLEAARAKRAEADAVRDQLTAAQGAIQAEPKVPSTASAVREFEIRTPADDRVPDLLRTLTQLANSPLVGKLEAVVIEAGSAAPSPQPVSSGQDPRLALFGAPVSGTPVAMSFEAGYEQVGRFLWNLRALPMTVDVRSIDVSSTPGSSRLRVKLELVAFRRADSGPSQRPALRPDIAQIAASPAPPDVDVTMTPTWRRDMFRSSAAPVAAAAPAAVPDPVVQTILYSPLRSVALIDGKIVKVGDRLNAGSVTAIERDAVTIETPSGSRKRLALKTPALRGTVRTP